jgi:23S rRNA (pseudouridine1915-N3)-methyltransferase
MKIRVISVSHKLPSWVEEGYQAYIQRFDQSMSFSTEQIAPITRNKSERERKKNLYQIEPSETPAEMKKQKQEEGKKILEKILPQDYVIALDSSGTLYDSIQLSQQLSKWLQSGQNLAFLIGGPDGLDDSCLKRANQRWSLSPLTFPHTLMKILLAEQVYRAWSILKQHPYHR